VGHLASCGAPRGESLLRSADPDGFGGWGEVFVWTADYADFTDCADLLTAKFPTASCGAPVHLWISRIVSRRGRACADPDGFCRWGEVFVWTADYPDFTDCADLLTAKFPTASCGAPGNAPCKRFLEDDSDYSEPSQEGLCLR